MLRPRSATLTLALLALAPGCSSQSSAPGGAPASNVQPEAPPESVEQAPAPASPIAPERERDDDEAAPAAEEAAAAPAPAGGEARKAKDALAPSRLNIEPMIDGGLDRDIIRRKAQDHEVELQACFDRSERAGTVAVKLEVDARGVVKDVELGADSELDDREVVDCVLKLISGWSFAGEATGKATVSLSLSR